MMSRMPKKRGSNKMAENPKCPYCGKDVKNADDNFVDHYKEGASIWFECKHCFAVFKLTQHYIPIYIVNECDHEDESDECGNVECEKNSFIVHAKLKEKFPTIRRDTYCTSHSDIFPCRKYKPTAAMIEAYEKETGNKYVPIEE